MSEGIVMVAMGDSYLKMAALAINSVLTVEPNVAVTLFTNEIDSDLLLTVRSKVNLVSIRKSELRFGDKIRCIANSPYEKTLYLDVDILAVRPFFQEVIRAHAYFPVLVRDGMDFNVDWEVRDYGWAIQQPNTGVISLNFADSKMRDFVELWYQIYRDRPAPHDQPAFRAALLESGVGHVGLSPDFNTLPDGILNYAPRILHFTGEQGNNILTRSPPEFLAKIVSGYLAPFADSDCGSLLHLGHKPILKWSHKRGKWIDLSHR